MKGELRMKEKKAMHVITWITGILTLLLGFYTVARPFRTFLTIGWILGTLFLVNGIELVILALSKEKKDIWACVLGILEGLAGIILLLSGLQRFLTDVVGTSILLYGVFQIARGIKALKVSKGKGILAIVCGVLSIIISFIAFSHPLLTMFSVGYMIAFSILMQGINMIVLAVNMGSK